MPNRGAEIQSADLALTNVVACVAIAGGAQSLTSGALTTLQFSAADLYDTTGMHNPASNNSRITIASAGWYAFLVYVDFNANATGNRTSYVIRTRGGVTTYLPFGASEVAVTGGFAHELMLVAADLAVAGDYYEAQALQNSGSARIVSLATFAALRLGS